MVVVGLLPLLLFGCVVGEEDQTIERRAQRLHQTLVCPVCPGETIDQSQVELAKQMRMLSREMLDQGFNEEEIRQFFVDRYGEGVLAAPPKTGFHLLAWLVPPAFVVGVLVAFAIVIRNLSVKSRKYS